MGGQSFDAGDNGGFTDYTMEKVCVNGASAEDCDHWFHLGQRLGLTDFNPTTVNWNKPVEWAGSNCSMSDSSGCLISLGLGFAIVVGFGVFFSIFTSMLVWMEKKFGGVKMTSEHFNTGGLRRSGDRGEEQGAKRAHISRDGRRAVGQGRSCDAPTRRRASA